MQLGTKEHIAEQLLAFAEALPESAEQLFSKYAQLLDAANEAETLVRETTACKESECDRLITEVRTNILGQAEKFLTSIVTTQEINQASETLEIFSADARVYVSLLRAVGIEKMTSQPLEQVPAPALAETDRNRMRELLGANFRHETLAFQALVRQSLEDHLSDNATEFYVLRDPKTGIVVSFNRFDTSYREVTGERIQYFGSFNADPVYQGVGAVMLERTISERMLTTDVMYAHCDPYARISQKYIEDGFIATERLYPADKLSFEIWRSRESAQQLKTKQLPVAELVAIADQTLDPAADYFVRTVVPGDTFDELDDGLGYLLTRYFTVGSKTYAAFEINIELSRQFQVGL